jgi:uncharacterized protein YutD
MLLKIASDNFDEKRYFGKYLDILDKYLDIYGHETRVYLFIRGIRLR